MARRKKRSKVKQNATKPTHKRPANQSRELAPAEMPTPERLDRAEECGLGVAFDPVVKNGPKVVRFIGPLERARRAESLTRRQYDAGKIMEPLLAARWRESGLRCTLDNSVAGYDGLTQPERSANISKKSDEIYDVLGKDRFTVARSIIVLDEPTGPRRQIDKRWRLFVEALDMTANYYWPRPQKSA